MLLKSTIKNGGKHSCLWFLSIFFTDTDDTIILDQFDQFFLDFKHLISRSVPDIKFVTPFMF